MQPGFRVCLPQGEAGRPSTRLEASAALGRNAGGSGKNPRVLGPGLRTAGPSAQMERCTSETCGSRGPPRGARAWPGQLAGPASRGSAGGWWSLWGKGGDEQYGC